MGICSIGMYLDKSPLSISNALETFEIFFKFDNEFFVSIFEIIKALFPTIFFTSSMSL